MVLARVRRPHDQVWTATAELHLPRSVGRDAVRPDHRDRIGRRGFGVRLVLRDGPPPADRQHRPARAPHVRGVHAARGRSRSDVADQTRHVGHRVTYRNPALLAKIVTTLDVISGGRAILGIGAAWNEKEAIEYGYAWPSTRERMDRLEDAILICRTMFTQEEATFKGRHHHIRSALNFPSPVKPRGPKIMVGGSGERRTLRLVAQYADACNLFGDVDTVRHKLAVLERHCRDVGRD